MWLKQIKTISPALSRISFKAFSALLEEAAFMTDIILALFMKWWSKFIYFYGRKFVLAEIRFYYKYCIVTEWKSSD